MATPVWSTTAGKIATIDEQVAYSLQLEANTSDSTAITYSVIAGSLPAGMQVTSTGLLTGTPAEVAKRTLYTFVVRATAGTTITDRTFSLDVQGSDAPVFTTASGQLQLDDSTSVGLYWVIDGASVSLQMQATDSDTRAGQVLVYEIVQGSLPPGVTMSKTGLISGIVQLTDD
jgi:large repetitive protein